LLGSERRNTVKKMCSKCGREVNETIHTQDSWIVDYYESVKADKAVIVLCFTCHKKK